jgi:hypothetical protein
MSTYDDAYSTTKFPRSGVNFKKTKEVFEVIEGNFVDSYHYHGSWFEYTWDLILKNTYGKIINKKLDTWRSYGELKGKRIEFDGTIFKVIS